MKKVTSLIMSLLVTSFIFADGLKTGNESNTSYSPNPNSGDVGQVINLYIAPSSYNNYIGSVSTFASYEIPMFDPNLTLGPEIGFAFGGNLNGFSSTTFVLNAKATYYFDWLIPNMPDMFDVFIVGTSGLYLSNYSNSTSHLGFDFGNYVGGRWNFQENISVYALAGYGSSIGAVGISFKL